MAVNSRWRDKRENGCHPLWHGLFATFFLAPKTQISHFAVCVMFSLKLDVVVCFLLVVVLLLVVVGRVVVVGGVVVVVDVVGSSAIDSRVRPSRWIFSNSRRALLGSMMRPWELMNNA